MAAGVLSSREPSTERSWRAATAAAAAVSGVPPVQALEFKRLQLRVVPFYYPGKADIWHERLGSGPLGNFVSTPSSCCGLSLTRHPFGSGRHP